MFGYVKPLRTELKIREFEQFKSCYCSLCHVLGREYGLAGRFILNFDFTFLAMLLWSEDFPYEYELKRCIASPCRKKCVCIPDKSLEYSAACSVILTYWKLRDAVADEGFFKRLGARAASLFLRRAYKKASARYPGFAERVKISLGELTEMEKANEPSIDRTADAFARILSSASSQAGEDEVKKRASEQVLYHTGRFIYLIDAFHDIEEDMARGGYNPIAARYGLKSPKIEGEALQSLKTTLYHSLNLIGSAFELMPVNPWRDIMRNIIYFGMPQVCDGVIDGTFYHSRDGMPR